MLSDASTAVMLRLEAVLNSDQVDAGLRELLASELLYTDQPVSPQHLCRARLPLWDAVPDVRWTLDEVIADSERVATRWTVTGTHQRDFVHPRLPGRAPATGQTIHVVYALFCHVINGKIVEVRDVSDRLTLYQQLRILPNMGLGSATHTIGNGS